MNSFEVTPMEDEELRLALARVATAGPSPHRDLIGPAVGIVLRRRRRVRTYGAAGSGLLVAMGATAALWVSGSPTAARPEPAASGTATTAAPKSDARTSAWDKSHDVFFRLPGLLNPLLPHGLTVAPNTSPAPGSAFRLNGPAGDNDFGLSTSPKSGRNRAMEEGCVVGGVCSGRTVPGGTLYIQTKNFTADYGGQSGYAPGTGKQVLTVDAEYEFVPAADDGIVVDVVLATAVSHEQYAVKAPKDWGDAPWPPSSPAGQAFNASGILLSPEEFTALVANPGFSAVSTLLDPHSPVAASTLARHKSADDAIATATKKVLPTGLTLAIDSGDPPMSDSYLTLTGPSGANTLRWSVRPQVATWRHGHACGGHTRTDCTWKEVPGGEIEITQTIGPPGTDPAFYAPGQIAAPYYREDTYTYYPDDTNGTVIQFAMKEQFRDISWSSTRPTTGPNSDPSTAWPPPARTGQPFNAAGPLVSVDQFADMVHVSGVVDAVRAVDNAEGPMNGDPRSFMG